MFRSFRRYFRLLLVSLPQRQHEGTSPVCLYQDREEGDVDQGALLTGGVFRFAQKTYSLPLRGVWQSNSWPEDVRRWFYGFDWLKDLRTFGTNGARLLARSMVASWADRPPADPVARESSVMGRRLANWLGHYEFCLSTATEGTQQLVLDAAVKEARRLSAMLPLPPMGWEGLAVLRGLLAVYMAVPYYDGFFKRFEQQLPLELKRLLGDEGIVAERSPEAQYRCVQELTAIQGMFTTLQWMPPDCVPVMLGRACAVLRAFCHGDGGLALFNGSQERGAKAVQALLEQAERYKVVASSLSRGGFARLTAGRALLLVDAAAPPPQGMDGMAHAGTLSFEFSHDRQRLFVNCGAAEGGPWRRALRSSAAHTILVVDGESSSDFGNDGHVTRRPSQVRCEQKRQGRVQELHLSHNGYYPSYGVLWSRSLFLEPSGEELRGSETVEGERDVSFMLRFHIHPDVRVEREDDDILLHAPSELWRFRQTGGVIMLEDDLYMGRGVPEQTAQIVVQSCPGRPLPPAEEEATEAGGRAAKASRRQQKVDWVLEHVPL
ncbi:MULTISPECIES: heparinase II/III family protein [Acetobacteraceae]|uniref:heparinase II/III family protein n=1 Tax=Acetobacteraceae TaxID=433 RepID=UPI000693E2B3|nr:MULTISPECIES: heparinase II/III family protein [Acetobacteraceae]MCQ0042194.1 heparinase II/III family protein [Bombella sp.]MUG78649.1 heparinase [Bombella sp. ESL0380]MUH01924.1 heparinase [Bombella sp. ESL0387]QGT74428.1 heparinase [Bombella sp. ESL0368]MCT6820284.1 heparinase II/III family protein [Bombella apis]